MYIIKLDAINSTNSYLKELTTKTQVEDFTVIVAAEQTKGRGQMGTVWQSEKHQNLMFSVFKDVSFLKIEQQFYISIVASLSIYKTLCRLQIPKLAVKWPNDILSGNKKVAGILIENMIKNNRLKSTVIGVGLNVNQLKFNKLPQATSLSRISGKVFDLDEVLSEILSQMKIYFQRLEKRQFQELKSEYINILYRINKPSTFKSNDGLEFSGYIKGVSELGKIIVLIEDQQFVSYDLKEISLLN